jgi:ribonucleotide monophosphatase NagD (HAD superfamily)
MVGDSPHTDILGGLGAGICSVLISSYGLLRDYDAEAECARLGIMPHWIVRAL